MFALSLLYTILFFYIRIQSNKFRAVASSTEQTTSHQLQNWQATVEVGSEVVHPSSHPVIIRTATVTTQDHLSTRRNGRSEADRVHRQMNQAAFRLLCYPILYICLTMPIATVALADLAGRLWFKPIYLASCFYASSGWANVVLYTATRKGIISWDWLTKRKRGSGSTAPQAHRTGGSRNSTLAAATVSSKLSAISISSSHPLVDSPELRNSESDSLSVTKGNHGSTIVISDMDKFVQDTDVVPRSVVKGSLVESQDHPVE
jgi:hypothetical protein